MSSSSIKIALTRRLPEDIETRMAELFSIRVNSDDSPLSRAMLATYMNEYDVLVPIITDRIDTALIEQAGAQLRLIANFGAGTDNIDVAAAHARGIIVTNTPSVLTEDTADMTLALILAVSRRLVEGTRIMQAPNKFVGWSPNWMLGHRVGGKKLGIIGMGRIGQAVARRARVFGMEIHYHNRKPVHVDIEHELAATYWDSLDRMLRKVDIITIHCPHTPSSYHLLSAPRLAQLQSHAIVINTSRGEVIDEAALADSLSAGQLGGAGLDVFEREPEVNPHLRDCTNAVLVPHMGSSTIEARRGMGEKVIINIRAFADGHRPPDRVLPPDATP